MIKVGILTVSDKGYCGQREDTSGDEIRSMLGRIEFSVERYEIVPDERPQIEAKLKEWADSGAVDLILTTGGTGLAPRDVTPEATLAVVERLVPGIAEVMRQESLKKTPYAMLSRSVAGARGATLIVNLPGSPRSVRENLEVILEALPHGIEKLKGDPSDCGRP